MNNPGDDWQKAAEVLKGGGLAVLPTDTIYGLTARAGDKMAVERLYGIRGRNPQKACIVLCANLSDFHQLGIKVNSEQESLLAEIWPNPVSVILPCPEDAMSFLHRGLRTLAVRIPKMPALRRLLEAVGPIVAPSANPERLPTANNVEEAKKYFGESVEFYVEGETQNLPSTLVELVGEKFKVIREGAWKVPENLTASVQ